MEPRVLSFRYEKDGEGRLDRFLAEAAPDFSRARLQLLIRQSQVSVDGVVARKSSQVLRRGAVVEVQVPPPAPTALVSEDIPLNIVYENDDVLVVNKPAGMVVHPAAGHAQGTLVNAALAHDPDMRGIGGEERPGVVHRLDKDTSGLILLAKNDSAMHWLQEQFSGRRVSKTYITLVDGRPPTPSGRVEAAIGRSLVKRKQMAVLPEGKGRAAVSEYKTLESFPQHTLLEFHPISGRTHQIRVHCAFLGCPVVGDTIYGLKKPSIDLGRHFLHARSIEVILPGDKEARLFEAELPDGLRRVLDLLRSQTVQAEAGPRERKKAWTS